MTKLDKKIETRINTKLEGILNEALNYEKDFDFVDNVISQIKQVILKEIMKDEVVNYEWREWSEDYIQSSFVRSSDIKNLLTDTDRKI